VPVINKYGLRPAREKKSKEISALSANPDLDKLGLLKGVTTFNFHPHLPHLEVVSGGKESIHVLARQPIDLDRPHPFIEAGNQEFNMLLWMPPQSKRAGDILFADSTIFTTLFGGTKSLETFWRNLATMKGL
jgi:hypothetical protein